MPALSASPQSLRVRAVRVPPGSPASSAPLLDLLPEGAEPLVWLGGRRSLVGFGHALRREFTGERAIRDAGLAWEAIRADAVVEAEPDAPAVPVALASFGFASTTPSVLVVPSVVVIDDEAGARWAVGAATGAVPDPLAALVVATDTPTAPRGLRTDVGRMTQAEWTASVAHMAARLREGEAAKAVMTRDMRVRADSRISERFLLTRLSLLYPTTWRFSVEGLVGATPEMLGAARDGRLTSRVLAGTAGPGHGGELMESAKDRREHEFAVASVTEALSPIVSDLDVSAVPFVLDLPNVSHLASDVSASLEEIGLLDAIAALHPTAAVCGSPRRDALTLLLDLERTERGRYSGPVGWIDAAGEGEFGLALRCGQLEDGGRTLRIFAGGGIMPDSDPRAELAETRAKMAPLLDALGL